MNPVSDTILNTSSSPQRKSNPTSLVDALNGLSSTIPTDIAYTFLNDGDTDETHISFRELEFQAQAIASRLQRTLKVGDRAALVFEPGLEYITALVGCFYAGVVAVPVYPPDPMRIQRTISRLEAIFENAEARIILTGQDEYDRFGSLLTKHDVCVTTQVDFDERCDFQPVEISPETLALLQYTSGSTGTPKGVMLSHGNLMFNFIQIEKFDEPNATAVSWLPMYHDMGLIGLVLQALQSGRRTVLMSPLSFVKRPFHWLNAISRYRAYATSGPNFAYELCVEKVTDQERDMLDLSCLTLAGNGAEPIRPDTMRRFAKRFEPCGFRWESFYPCYGLAEATLIVSGGEKLAAPVIRTFDGAALDRNQVVPVPPNSKNAREIVGCGESVADQEVKIVDPTTRASCQPNQIGEVWVHGPGVGQGYWNNPQSSEETFFGITSDSQQGPYLRTGDLGFVQDEELFITGRIKELIIIRGRNHYPQDIERTVEHCHPSLRRGHGAAFGITMDGEEKLVVLQGIVRPQKIDLPGLFADIRTALLHEHELSAHAIVFVRCGQIPRTSSGKTQRRACKEMFENGELDIVAQWLATDERHNDVPFAESRQAISPPDENHDVLSNIADIVRDLKNGHVSSEISHETLIFADLGLESIDLIMLNEMIERHYQNSFPFQEFMADLGRKNQRDVSIGQMVTFIANELRSQA